MSRTQPISYFLCNSTNMWARECWCVTENDGWVSFLFHSFLVLARTSLSLSPYKGPATEKMLKRKGGCMQSFFKVPNVSSLYFMFLMWEFGTKNDANASAHSSLLFLSHSFPVIILCLIISSVREWMSERKRLELCHCSFHFPWPHNQS